MDRSILPNGEQKPLEKIVEQYREHQQLRKDPTLSPYGISRRSKKRSYFPKYGRRDKHLTPGRLQVVFIKFPSGVAKSRRAAKQR